MKTLKGLNSPLTEPSGNELSLRGNGRATTVSEALQLVIGEATSVPPANRTAMWNIGVKLNEAGDELEVDDDHLVMLKGLVTQSQRPLVVTVPLELMIQKAEEAEEERTKAQETPGHTG